MTDTHAMLETIRSLEEGDTVSVTLQQGRFSKERKEELVVSNVTEGDRPLIDTDDDRHLEYDEHYSEGTPYNLRDIGDPDLDGASVVGVEVL